ncbi:hypothetical protein BJX63DRAFT_416073 [Aspergillus granulosus]|uniref:Uncharacterized protein n=1 Tax=Aspergillus granulosus TaxID=176169 RepID=A0ABR4GSE5_9EURO
MAFLRSELNNREDGPLANLGFVREPITEDIVWGRLTGAALNVAIAKASILAQLCCLSDQTRIVKRHVDA